MSLIYVTGVSGAGKSSACLELRKRGFEAHDTDEDGFRGWYNLKTKKMINVQIGYNDASKEWLQTHQLRIKREPVKRLVPKDPNKKVFLCGTTPNDGDVSDLFDKIIYLVISESTLHERIHSRTNNKFGKDPDEYRAILSWHKDSVATAQRIGATIIDAEQPVDKVVDLIVSAAS